MQTVTPAATSSSVVTEVIRVRGLTFTYPKAPEPAVRGMDFSVGRGEIFGFLGPSGAGKSTTQKLLIGLLRGHGGEAAVWGKDPLAWGPDYYQRIGVSFELPNHYQKLTGLENLRFFASLYDGATLDPMELLDAVGLADDANTRVGKYSKGMQMRLTFARSLINDPELLYLDEPTSGLDPVNARKVKNMILDLKSRGRTVFLTTHDMATANELCDRVAFVVDGQIVALDTPTELKIARSQRLVRVEYRGENGRLETADFAMDGLADDPGVPRGAARAPRGDHPQPGSQPRRRVRGGHRQAADVTRLASALRLEVTLAGPAAVPARSGVLRAHLAGRAAADAAAPAPGRRALHPVGRPGHHRVLLRRGHRVLREAGAHPRRGHLHPAAVLGIPGRQTGCPAGDYTGRLGHRGHGCARVRLPSGAAAGGRGARDAADAAGGIHHLAAVRLGQRLVPGGDHPARGDVGPAGPALLRRVAKPDAVSDPHAGTAAVARRRRSTR